jgi:hypothetical protein
MAIRIKIDGNTIVLDGADEQRAQQTCSDLGVERNRLRAQRVEEEMTSLLRDLARKQAAYDEATDKVLTKAAKLARVRSVSAPNDRAIGRALPVVSDD